MEKNAQWRFTPPTHVLAAFNQALIEHQKEGQTKGRHERYKKNCKLKQQKLSPCYTTRWKELLNIRVLL